MRLTLMTPPAEEPISLEEIKEHLRLAPDDDEEDELLLGMIKAARQKLDGRDGFLGRALVAQTWRLTLDCFPRIVSVPLPPLQSVTSITYLDAAGDEQTLEVAAYHVDGIGDSERATIRPARGRSWPSTWEYPGAVAITFVAGYGEPDDVPDPIRQALRLHVGHLYNNREATAEGKALSPIPLGWAEHVADFRMVEV